MQRSLMALAVFLVATSSAPAAAQTPRYGFTAGQHTVYRRVVRTTGGSGPTQTRVQQLQYWTLDTGTTATLLGELTEVVGREARSVGGLLLEIDDRQLHPLSDEFVGQIDALHPLLEPWPTFPDALRIGVEWRMTDPFGRVFEVAPLPAEPAARGQSRWRVTLSQEAGAGPALGQTYEGSLTFDPVRRIVTRTEGTWTSAGSPRQTQVLLELYTQDQVGDDWRNQRKPELRRYRQTLGLQQRYLERLTRTPERADQLLADVTRFWSELAFYMNGHDGPIRRLVKGRRKAWETDLAGWQQRARQVAAWRDIRAPRWLLLTADGRAVRSEELGVPVLELLWSPLVLSSGLALEDLRQLREQVPLADLAIICIHLHGDREDLERSRALTGPDILHLRPEAPAYDEDLRLPIARLRTADGTVREISYGPRPVWRSWLQDQAIEEEGG